MELTRESLINKFSNLNKTNQINWNRNEILQSIHPDAFKGLTCLVGINLVENMIQSIERDTFKNLHNLASINFRKNQIKFIHQNAFNCLIGLNDICFSYNKIQSVHKDTFRGLSNLSFINLGHNQIKSIHQETFKGLTCLTYIRLDNNQIQSIHSDIFKGLKNLLKIDLRNNQIESIHQDAFNGLTILTDIDLWNNKIGSIHKDTFKSLTSLTTIDLSNNQIASLHHDTFNGLSNLKLIGLKNNPFKSKISLYLDPNINAACFDVPIEIKSFDWKEVNRIYIENQFPNLNRLTEIDLSKNQIDSIHHDVFNNLVALDKIDFSFNRIQLIENDFLKGLINITELNLCNNQINSINQDAFKHLANLKVISLSSNKIQSIHQDTFRDLTRLTTIDLSNNLIKLINQDTFKSLNNLFKIDLSRNYIQYVDENTFLGLVNLKKVFLSNNPLRISAISSLFIENINDFIIDVPIKTKSIKSIKLTNKILTNKLSIQENTTEIDFSENSITSIKQNAFKSFISLIYINLSNNQIQSIHQDTFKSLSSLSEIKLNNNQILSIHQDTFKGLNNLIRIFLDKNQIYSLHKETFKGLIKLQAIHLSYNQIQSIHQDIFVGLINIKQIDLSYNQIKSIHQETFENLNNISRIKLKNNPFESNISFYLDQSLKNSVFDVPIENLIKIEIEKKVFKKYKKIKSIGEGSFGNIFLVKNSENQLFSMKITEDDDYIYIRETEILKSLQSSYICKYYEHFISSDNIYLITEYFEDGDLRKRIELHQESNIQFDTEKVLKWSKDIICGIEYLHSNSIIHTDIKPEKFSIQNDHLKICGFDRARNINANFQNSINEIIDYIMCFTYNDYDDFDFISSTQKYMSPEMLKLEKSKFLCFKTDVWSTGVVIYEIASLKYPFKANSGIKELVNSIKNDEISNIETETCIKILIDGMLQKDKNLRLSSTQLKQSLFKFFTL